MEHVHSEHVAADPDRVFAALRDPATLQGFVPQLTRVEQQGDGQVAVEARYDGRTQRGDAYFRTDEPARKIEWGTDSGYHGWLAIEPDDDGSMLTLGLHTTHVEHADQDVAGTLDAIRRLVEAQV
jgi:hypothetical protein